ncbi:MAG TPA: prephenate dehydrogenase/arogenate dehydrogenase family protein [Candidatus Acidoferrum sp.]|jgi:prephenate dehydrogenase
MPSAHLINRVTILGTGLIGGSFALALRKYTPDIHITGFDRPDVVREAQFRKAIDVAFFADLGPALESAELIYIALPIGATLDLLPEIVSKAPTNALITDACSTKLRVTESAAELVPEDSTKLFLGGHPMAGKEHSGIAHADPDLFQNSTYALVATSPSDQADPRISAFTKILEKIGARPLWLGAQQHDYAVGLSSHLPQLASVALASFLYDHLDENGLPITLAGPGLRDSLRLAGSPYSTWRDIVLTNKQVLSAALDLFARRLDDLRERLASRDLEADFDAANELYKLLRSL